MNPCWTCRNRRVQCDLSGSPCAKCIKAGVECFDKRPFRWVKGVAIRGNLQGYSYEGNPDKPKKKARASKLVQAKQKISENALVRAAEDTRCLPAALQDPSILNLDRVSRYYINYCKSSTDIGEANLGSTDDGQIMNIYASCSLYTTATGTHSGASSPSD